MIAPACVVMALIMWSAVAIFFWLVCRIFGSSLKVIIGAAFVAAAAALLLPLAAGVWVPDAFSGNVRTLASTKLPDGTDFQVVQWWGVDFYTTQLWVTQPDGKRTVETLDGDDCKSWHIPMSVDSHNRTVSVTLCGGREKTVSW